MVKVNLIKVRSEQRLQKLGELTKQVAEGRAFQAEATGLKAKMSDVFREKQRDICSPLGSWQQGSYRK